MKLLASALPFALLAAPFVFRRLHRIEPPPPLTHEQTQAAFALIRRSVLGEEWGKRHDVSFERASASSGSGGLQGKGATPAQGSAPSMPTDSAKSTGNEPLDASSGLSRYQLNGPLFVSCYLGGDRRSPTPIIGWWQPKEQNGRRSLEDAIGRASDMLRGRLAERVKDPRGVPMRFKLDLAGAPLKLWSSWLPYVDFVVNPGIDGLFAHNGDASMWILPSWRIERGWDTRKMLSAAWSAPGLNADATLARFRTRTYVEAPNPHDEPLELYRGNVLIDKVNPSIIRRGLRAAAAYLTRMVGRDGRFCYTYHAGRDQCGRDYNLLRHAGTTYSMFQLYRELGEPSLLRAAERATQWLRRRTRRVEGDPSRIYLLEGRKAKLGAVGLSLLALVERERALRDGRDRALMEGMARFIISQQREDGYLESWFDWGEGADVPVTNSIYYPGEALLGLIRLYQIDPRADYLEAALRSARFLALKRWRWGGIELYVPPDAWLTQALAELYMIHQDDALRDYAYEITEVTEVTMLRRAEGAPPDLAGGPAFGPFLPNVTPAGSRSEGLTAAWFMAEFSGQQEKQDTLLALALESAPFQLNHQFRPENTYYLPNPARAMGGFRANAQRLDIRIDYVQHNVTGLIGLLKILENRPLDSPKDGAR